MCIAITALIAAISLGVPQGARSPTFTLTGRELPTYYATYVFFQMAVSAAEDDERRLQQYLNKYGVPTPSSARETLLREARLAVGLHEGSFADAASARSQFRDEAQYQPWRESQQSLIAEQVGNCFGRFLAEIRSTGDRIPENFEDLLRARLGQIQLHVEVGPSDRGQVEQHLATMEAAFRRGVSEMLE